MEVRATTQGYYSTLRHEGEVFNIKDDSHLGSWMEAVLQAKTKTNKAKPKKKKAAAKKVKY
jgi:hypothetical protein